MTRKQITDIVFSFRKLALYLSPTYFLLIAVAPSVFFMFFMGIFAWIGRCFSFPTPGVAADSNSSFRPRMTPLLPSSFLAGLRVAYRAFVETVSRFRLGTLIRKAADAMVGAYNARAPSPRDGGDTAPSTHATSPQSLEQLEDQRPGGIAATHDGASSAGIHHHQACLASA
jgi:hypothetical protein